MIFRKELESDIQHIRDEGGDCLEVTAEEEDEECGVTGMDKELQVVEERSGTGESFVENIPPSQEEAQETENAMGCVDDEVVEEDDIVIDDDDIYDGIPCAVSTPKPTVIVSGIFA